MNLVYLAFLGDKLTGVTKKIISQYKALKELKINITLHFFGSRKPDNLLAKYIIGEENIKYHYPPKNYSGFFLRRWKFDKAYTILQNYNKNNNLVYIRDPACDYFFYIFLRKIRKHKVLIEYQDLHSNLKHQIANPYRFINEIIFERSVLNLINGAVCVTSKIKEHIRNINHNIPILVNPNGIEVEQTKLRKIPEYNGKEVRIIFVGSLYKPQGVDRMLKGIRNYNIKSKNKKKIFLTIVGNPNDYYLYLTRKMNLKQNVKFVGYKTGEMLNNLFDINHIALGVLAIHRKGDGSALKNREYTARGIPFIDSTEDEDFPMNWDYRLKIDSNEKPLDINRVITFVNTVMEDKKHNLVMREFAKKNLSWGLKCRKLVNFIEDEIM